MTLPAELWYIRQISIDTCLRRAEASQLDVAFAYYAPAVGERFNRYRDPSVRLSVCLSVQWRSCPRL